MQICHKDGENYVVDARDSDQDRVIGNQALFVVRLPLRVLRHIVPQHHLRSFHLDIAVKCIQQHLYE